MENYKDKNDNNIKGRSGILIAGDISVVEILLWTIILLPIEIIISGAGVCFTDIGLFAGTSYIWIFLVKRLRSYSDISEKNIYCIQDFLYARYSSVFLKKLISLIWIILLGTISGAVLMFMSNITGQFTGENSSLIMYGIMLLVVGISLFKGRVMSILKSLIYLATVIICIAMIVILFIQNTPAELLDIYRCARLPGGTSIYLNIMYMDGKPIAVLKLINMLAVGFGCMGLPIMFEGAFTAKDLHELDKGRVLSIIYTGLLVIILSVWALLSITCIYPEKVSENGDIYKLISMFIAALFSDFAYTGIIRTIIFIIFGVSVLFIFETNITAMAGMVEDLVWADKGKLSAHVKLITDIIALLLVVSASYIFSRNCSSDYSIVIKAAWSFCEAIAAPVILSILWERSSKTGIISGILSGILVTAVWSWVPVRYGNSLTDITGIDAGIAGFIIAFIVTIIFSNILRNNDLDEMEVFRKMRNEQK
jgi:sodium/proline symporter